MSGTGSAAVLLHGFTGSAAAWGEPVVSCLGAAGIAADPVDLPGHGRHAGRSDPSAVSIEAAFDAIGTGASASHDRELPTPIIGYSMGGRIALHFAVQHPGRVTRLVLESASPGLETEPERVARREADAALADRIERLGLERFVEEWEKLPLFASQRALPEAVRTMVRSRRLANDPTSLAAALRTLGTGSLPSLWEELATLRVPTLVMVGELDTKFVDIGRRMAATLPRGRLVVVPRVGHAVHLEDPSTWCAEVGAFLTDD